MGCQAWPGGGKEQILWPSLRGLVKDCPRPNCCDTHVRMTEWERDVRSSRSNFIAHNFLNVMISYNVLSAYQLLAVPKCFTHAIKVY